MKWFLTLRWTKFISKPFIFLYINCEFWKFNRWISCSYYIIYVCKISRKSKINCYVIKKMLKIKGPYGNVVLETLFVLFENTCRWKKYVKALVMLFKHWKLLFKIHYQTVPKFLWSQIVYKKISLLIKW